MSLKLAFERKLILDHPVNYPVRPHTTGIITGKRPEDRMEPERECSPLTGIPVIRETHRKLSSSSHSLSSREDKPKSPKHSDTAAVTSSEFSFHPIGGMKKPMTWEGTNKALNSFKIRDQISLNPTAAPFVPKQTVPKPVNPIQLGLTNQSWQNQDCIKAAKTGISETIVDCLKTGKTGITGTTGITEFLKWVE